MLRRLYSPVATAAVFTAVLCNPLGTALAADCYSWPVESVYDGDTLRATVEGQSTRIRIMGLDTPELPPHSKCARSEEHTSELQSLMRISYAVFCLKKKKKQNRHNKTTMTTK